MSCAAAWRALWLTVASLAFLQVRTDGSAARSPAAMAAWREAPEQVRHTPHLMAPHPTLLQVVTSGTPPHGRVSHTATLHGGAVHVFGGSAGGACFNDYLVLTPGSESKPAPLLKESRRSSPIE